MTRLTGTGKGYFSVSAELEHSCAAATFTSLFSQRRPHSVPMSSQVTLRLKAQLMISSGCPLPKTALTSLSMAWNEQFNGEGLVKWSIEHADSSDHRYTHCNHAQCVYVTLRDSRGHNVHEMHGSPTSNATLRISRS